MFRTFGNTLSLLGTSWRVLRREGLMSFPLAAGLSLLAILLYVLVAFQYGGTFDRLRNGFEVLPADFIFLGLAYLGASFVIVYFSAALVAAAHYRIMGGAPDFRLGLEAANDRLGAIAVWSVIACTLGLVVKHVASSGGFVGKAGGFFAELLAGWAPFLVVPVMIVEGAPPLEAMRRSTDMFKETWGRDFVGNFGFGMLYFAVLALTVGAAVVLLALGASAVATVVTAMMFFSLTAAVLKCLEAVFVVALYNYATVGESDGAFTRGVLREAYVYKKSKGRFGTPPTHRRAAA
jgi:hypothetical protein